MQNVLNCGVSKQGGAVDLLLINMGYFREEVVKKLESVEANKLTPELIKSWVDKHSSKLDGVTSDLAGLYLTRYHNGVLYPIYSTVDMESGYITHDDANYIKDLISFMKDKSTVSCMLNIEYDTETMKLSLIGVDLKDYSEQFRYDMRCSEALASNIICDVRGFLTKITNSAFDKPVKFSTDGYRVIIDCESYFGEKHKFGGPGTLALCVDDGKSKKVHSVSIYTNT